MKMTPSEKKFHMLIVIFLITILSIVGFLVLQKKQEIKKEGNNIISKQNINLEEAIIFTDKRCPIDQCNIPLLKEKLQESNSLKNTNFIIKDYSKYKEEIKGLMSENKIKGLPFVLFNTNKIDKDKIDSYLQKTKDGRYSLLAGLYNPIAQDKLEKRKTKTGSLDVFTMGYCPFGEIALKKLPKLKENFEKDGIKIDIHYIADKVENKGTLNDFDSLHGVTEVEEDIRQLCIKKYYGVDTLINYLQERYKNPDNYGKISEKPEEAYKKVNINKEKINKCISKGEGRKLLEEDIKLAQELGIGASPTWLANNKYKFGGIKVNNIKLNFCKYNSNFEGCKGEIKEEKTTGGTPTCGG